jgi:hypothetical protein
MTKQNGAGDEVVGNHAHNAKELKAKIQDVFRRQCVIDEQIKAKQADRREVRSELKGIGMTLADFDAECRLMKLEAEDRAAAKTNRQMCREAFEELQPGEIADLLKTHGVEPAHA